MTCIYKDFPPDMNVHYPRYLEPPNTRLRKISSDIRRKTFHNYPDLCERLGGEKKIENFVKNGFVPYSPETGTLMCTGCYCNVYKWKVNEDVTYVHKKIYPDCPFVLAIEKERNRKKRNVFFRCIVYLMEKID